MSLHDGSTMRYMTQGDEIWLLLFRKARGFLQDESEQQLRPFMMLLFCIHPHTMLLDEELITEPLGALPAPKHIWEKMLVRNIRQPRIEKKVPQRPKSIIFTHQGMFQALQPTIAAEGILPKFWTEEENQAFGDETWHELSKKLREKSRLGYTSYSLAPGLLTTNDDLDHVRAFYTAAAKFRKVQPWKDFGSRQLFTVSWPGRGTRLFFLAITDEISLGSELNPVELAHLYRTGERKTLDPSVEGAYHRLLTFNNEFNVPLEDLDAVERHGWPVSGNYSTHKCFPFPYCFRKSITDDMFRPGQTEMDWWTLACECLVRFTLEWREGKHRDDAETTAQRAEQRAKEKAERIAKRKADKAAAAGGGGGGDADDDGAADDDDDADTAVDAPIAARALRYDVKISRTQIDAMFGYWAFDLNTLYLHYVGPYNDHVKSAPMLADVLAPKRAGGAAAAAAAGARTAASVASSPLSSSSSVTASSSSSSSSSASPSSSSSSSSGGGAAAGGVMDDGVSDLTACKVCGVSDGVALKRCGFCKRKLYCGVDCQKRDWPTHKQTCQKKT